MKFIKEDKKKILIVFSNSYLLENWGFDKLNSSKLNYEFDIIDFGISKKFATENNLYNFFIQTFWVPLNVLKKIFTNYELAIFHDLGDWHEICYASLTRYKKSLIFFPTGYTSYQLPNHKFHKSPGRFFKRIRTKIISTMGKLISLSRHEKTLSCYEGSPFKDNRVSLLVTVYSSLREELKKYRIKSFNISSFTNELLSNDKKLKNVLILLPLLANKYLIKNYINEFLIDLGSFLKNFDINKSCNIDIKAHPRQELSSEKYIIKAIRGCFKNYKFRKISKTKTVINISPKYKYIIGGRSAALNELVKNGHLGRVFCFLNSNEFYDIANKSDFPPELLRDTIFSEGVTLLDRNDYPKCDLPFGDFYVAKANKFSIKDLIKKIVETNSYP